MGNVSIQNDTVETRMNITERILKNFEYIFIEGFSKNNHRFDRNWWPQRWRASSTSLALSGIAWTRDLHIYRHKPLLYDTKWSFWYMIKSFFWLSKTRASQNRTGNWFKIIKFFTNDHWCGIRIQVFVFFKKSVWIWKP